jgi:hypothetical protein
MDALEEHTLRPYFKYLNDVSLLHIGHARFSVVTHPDNLPYAGKSFIVHNNVACNWNVYFFYASYTHIPSFYKFFKSSTNGRKYTSIFFSGSEGLWIIMDNIKFGLFIHIHGGRLYNVNITAYMLYVVLILPYGLKSSLAKPSRTLRESLTNHL